MIMDNFFDSLLLIRMWILLFNVAATPKIEHATQYAVIS